MENSSLKWSDLEGAGHTFPNTAYLGIPLFLALGDQQAVGTAIAATVAANTLFIGGTLAFYAVRDSHGGTKRRAIGDAVRSLIRNPLIVAPLVALPFAFFSIPIPVVADRFLDLLGVTAGPAALFALGLSFIGRPFEATGRELVALSAIKLVAQPALVAFFAFAVLPVSPPNGKVSCHTCCIPNRRVGVCPRIAAGPLCLSKFSSDDRHEASIGDHNSVVAHISVASVVYSNQLYQVARAPLLDVPLCDVAGTEACQLLRT